MSYRIQDISPSVARECLAGITRITVDWLALLRGELVGEARFENQWYLKDKATGAYISKEANPAPQLRISMAEAMAFQIELPEPITVLTGAHMNMLLRAMHAHHMELLLAPPPPPEPEPELPPEGEGV